MKLHVWKKDKICYNTLNRMIFGARHHKKREFPENFNLMQDIGRIKI